MQPDVVPVPDDDAGDIDMGMPVAGVATASSPSTSMSGKRVRDAADSQAIHAAHAGKWTLDSIGEMLATMNGRMSSLTHDVREVRRTVAAHSESIDALQCRMSILEAKQESYSPAPSVASASTIPPPTVLRSSQHVPASSQPAPSRRDGEEAVVIGAFKEGSRKSEIVAALQTIVAALDEEVRSLVTESFAPGAVGELGIIKVRPTGTPQKSNMWRLYHALKGMDLHGILTPSSESILPVTTKLRPRPSKTPEQRVKDREITWTLLALRKVAELKGIALAEDTLRLGSAGKVYMDRTLIGIIDKERGSVQWKTDKLPVVGLPPAPEIDAIRSQAKQESLTK